MTKNKYEEDFFEILYKDRIGTFSMEDLNRNKRWFNAWIDLVKRTIKLEKGKRVLEIGCAIGGASALLKDNGFDIVASDVSSYVIKYAKKLRPDIRFEIIDISKPVMVNGLFDCVIAFEVLEHVESPSIAIKNIKKKLRKGGWIVFSTPPPFKRFLKTPTHINVHGKSYWTKALVENGFKKEEIIIKDVTFVPFFYNVNKHFNFAMPFHIDNWMVVPTTFYFAKNHDKI